MTAPRIPHIRNARQPEPDQSGNPLIALGVVITILGVVFGLLALVGS